MRSQAITQRKSLPGVMGLRPVNDGAKIEWLVVNQVSHKSRYMIHPGVSQETRADLNRYAKGLVEHCHFFKIENGNTITISEI